LHELAPGDYFDELRLDPRISQETVAALRQRFGADRPAVERYLRWLGNAARGDLGYSVLHNAPVTSVVLPRARNTLVLTATALLVSWLIAIAAGVWMASKRHGGARLGEAGIAAMLSMPELLAALAALVVAVRTGWFPAGGMVSIGWERLPPLEQAADIAAHLVLPVLVLLVSTLPVLVRHVRAAMSEALEAPFITAARSHGIRRARLIWFHAFRAAANPLISLFGVSVGALLSMSLLVEIVLSWPGLGPLVLEAILARDVFIVLGAMLLSAVLMLAGNLIADLALYALDPRIRVH
jgi:peptide/nickel transport system permease protein